MATSGTYSFLMNRDSLIAASLRTLEIYGAGEPIPALDITNCAEALNIMVKAMVLDGLPLWCVETVEIPLVAEQAAYSIGPVTPAPRPLRVLQAFLRKADDTDQELAIVSRFDYNGQSDKMQASTPTQLSYDPQLSAGVVYVYPRPATADDSLAVVVQRPMQDFNLATDNPDFPSEAYQMLKWCLADELALEYGAKPMKMQVCAAKAKTYREAFTSFGQEQASLYFLPSGRRN